jgi:hypothetical protein
MDVYQVIIALLSAVTGEVYCAMGLSSVSETVDCSYPFLKNSFLEHTFIFVALVQGNENVSCLQKQMIL